MASKNRAGTRKDRPGNSESPFGENAGTDRNGSIRPRDEPEPGTTPVLRRHALALIVFFLSLFFIITVTNPAIYMNDEWITANQLHQLDIGHQVTFSEGKYGVTQNGTVSAYFTSRQNVLMYSLALPLSAMPAVKMFGLFGDNFRLIVIMIWSLCLVLMALLVDVFYPAYARIRGMRILFPALLLALLLFMGNVLLYKQFPFSAADAPFEVAALVLTNQVFFALIMAVIFETLSLFLKNGRLALFGTLATVSCSSYLFWAATAKDHILSTLVFSLVMYLFLLYLSRGKPRDAALAFVLSGLLVWIRPELGFFVTIILGLSFIVHLVQTARSTGGSVRQLLVSVLPAAGLFVGLVPFFINNNLVSHNWLIPAVDLPRDLVRPGNEAIAPLPLSEVVTDPSVITQTSGLTLSETLFRAWDMVMHAMFGGITFENLVRGFIGIMTFPENQSIGFLIMCPLVVIGACALALWWNTVSAALESRKNLVFFVFLMMCAVFFSYLTKFNSMNISLGVLPDMRYLSPAYAPCGILSIFILSKTPCLKKDNDRLQSLLKYTAAGSFVIVPVIFLVMLFIQPFTKDYAGFSLFFQLAVLFTLGFCIGAMILSRAYPAGPFIRMVPLLMVLVIITVFSFQIMMTSLYALIVKINGYPFWIPIIREAVGLFLEVRYMSPV